MVHKSIKWFKHLKYITCIPIEAICFIFGFISCVMSLFCISILTLTVIFIKPNDFFEGFTRDINGEVGQYEDLSPDFSYIYLKYETLPLTSYFMVLFNFFACSFFFSVILCCGIHKRNPTYLKAYLVYALAVTVLILLILFYSYTWVTENGDAILARRVTNNLNYHAASAGIGFGIWMLILNAIMRAHQLFRAERYGYHRLPQLHSHTKHSYL